MKTLFYLFLAVLVMFSCGGKESVEAPVTTSKKLVTLTYNIHHGAPENSNEVNLNNIANVIKKSGAEIIALQEVDVNVPRSGKVNQAAELAKLLNMNYYFSKSIDYNGGEYGVAILSKYTLSNARKELLPNPASGEQRSIAIATITLPSDVTIEFAATHLDLNETNRMAQVEYINSLSKTLSKPLFVGGDYNAESSSKELTKFKEEFNLSCLNSCPLSFPVRTPNKAIDFVAFNKLAASRFSLVAANAMTGEYASDHLPVTVVFNYK